MEPGLWQEGLGEGVNQVRGPGVKAPSDNNSNPNNSGYLWSRLPWARLCAQRFASVVSFPLHTNPSRGRRLGPETASSLSAVTLPEKLPGGFPGSPEVENLPFLGSMPGQGTKIPQILHATWPGQKERRKASRPDPRAHAQNFLEVVAGMWLPRCSNMKMPASQQRGCKEGVAPELGCL